MRERGGGDGEVGVGGIAVGYEAQGDEVVGRASEPACSLQFPSKLADLPSVLVRSTLVDERYVRRLRKKLQFEERKQANQRRKEVVVQLETTDVRVLNQSDDDHLVLELGLNFLRLTI